MIQVTFALSFIVSAGSSKASSLPGSLQRSRSDIDVNAAAGAKAHHAAGQSVRNGRLGAGALNPGSYASLGKTTDCGKLYHVLSHDLCEDKFVYLNHFYSFLLFKDSPYV